MLSVEGVSFSYRAGQPDEVVALRDLDLLIDAGEHIAIIGHNGSGKSTLARLLTALLYPTQGRILVDGILVAPGTRWQVRERVSIVFQDPDDQLVATRVVDDVAFGPENLGLPRAEIQRRVDEALEALHLSPLRDTLIAELSLGDKQRVALAGALAMRPRYLILDEPTSFLPVPLAEQLLGTVRDIARREDMSVLHVTHHMGEAVHFDRVVVLNAGTLALAGPPAEVFERADRLRAIGLDVPLPVSLTHRLRAAGLDVAGLPLTPRALAHALASLAGVAAVDD